MYAVRFIVRYIVRLAGAAYFPYLSRGMPIKRIPESLSEISSYWLRPCLIFRSAYSDSREYAIFQPWTYGLQVFVQWSDGAGFLGGDVIMLFGVAIGMLWRLELNGIS